jgi:hypothetical protein
VSAPSVQSSASIDGLVIVLEPPIVQWEVATSTLPAAIVALFDTHAVVLLLATAAVVSTGEEVATPVNELMPIWRPLTLVEKFAVIVVPDASPEGAWA